jgi:hypothetical protein
MNALLLWKRDYIAHTFSRQVASHEELPTHDVRPGSMARVQIPIDDVRLALYQDFRKFEKNSKAGAEQEIFSKMAGAAKKKSGIPQKIWGSNPGIELGQLTKLTTKSPGNQLCTCLFEVGR